MVGRTFTFSKADIAVLKQGLPPRLRDTATTFEVVVAAVWRARTIALEVPPDEHVRLAIAADFRGLPELGLPSGYYGNAFMTVVVVTAAGALQASFVSDVVELVQEAKAAAMTAEYVRSMADFLVLRGRSPSLAMVNLFAVSYLRHVGFHQVDFGWGEPVYGGPMDTLVAGSFIVAVKNEEGEDALAAPIVLPKLAMDRFASEIMLLLKKD